MSDIRLNGDFLGFKKDLSSRLGFDAHRLVSILSYPTANLISLSVHSLDPDPWMGFVGAEKTSLWKGGGENYKPPWPRL